MISDSEESGHPQRESKHRSKFLSYDDLRL
jgi:hypothetical protein